MILVHVYHVGIPKGSSVAVCTGKSEAGEVIRFAAEHREARAIGEAIESGTEVFAEVEAWQILEVFNPAFN